MKVVITGGGSGGHFYPLIAVADKIIEQSEDRKILRPEIYYLADKPYDEQLLFRKNIRFRKIYSGKLRKYFSIKNFFDIFKTLFGTIKTIFLMFGLYPDIIFTNGSYISMPVLVSARILGIPVIVHASDSVPGKAVLFGSKFAKKISIAFVDAAEYFKESDKEKIALLGNPIREEIIRPLHNGAHEFLELDKNLPTILIMGGSLGAQAINDAVVDALPQLLLKYNVIHQCGKANEIEVKGRSDVSLYDHPYKERYKLFPYLDDLAIRMATGASVLAIIRAGAGTISEVANWGIPSITVPIPKLISHDQEKNAFAYAKSGASVVMLQKNLSANLVISEIERITNDKELSEKMSLAAKNFAKPDAANTIASAVLDIALEHEK